MLLKALRSVGESRHPCPKGMLVELAWEENQLI